jgi:hypothetical protein
MKANGAQGCRFPGVIASGYPPNNGLHLTRLSGRLAKVAGPTKAEELVSTPSKHAGLLFKRRSALIGQGICIIERRKNAEAQTWKQ